MKLFLRRVWMGTVVFVLLVGVSPTAPIAAPMEDAPTSALAMPFGGPCIDCEPCGGYTGHIAPQGSEGNWNAGHGSHGFCWVGFTCDDRHNGPCGVLPVASFTELLEQARLAAVDGTPDELLALPEELSSYVAFNDERQAIQVKACDGSGRIVANFPVQWTN